MLKARVIYLKEKQAFAQDGKDLRFAGKPIEVAKKLKKEGCELLHIVDVDAKRGMNTNFDIYDKLTYIMHIEVEAGENEHLVNKLVAISARVAIDLPTKLDLGKYKEHERLVVGKISPDYKGSIDRVYDLIIESANIEAVKKFAKTKKRLIVYKKDFTKEMEKYVFAVIE